jgi:ribonuclease D
VSDPVGPELESLEPLPVDPEAIEADEPEIELPPLPLLELSDGLPTPIESDHELNTLAERLSAGTGPVAVDVERASGYRYGQRAYLVQIRRAGVGTALVDPVYCDDLSALQTALAGVEWVLHAANQDLPGLAELGMRPDRLFDTELAARLAAFERVGLATMVPLVLGLRLEKGHSAADWSQRPLPEALLRYAALDVEPLIPLRDHLEALLREQGKLDWAAEEFEAARTAAPARPRTDPWRRTSGIHRLRTRRQLAVVRALWEARDEVARRNDIAPGRVLQDAAIVAAAQAAPASVQDLMAVPGFAGRGTRRRIDAWYAAVADALAAPEDALPPPTNRDESGAPPTTRWFERDPVAAARLARLRAAVAQVAAAHDVPLENLLEPAVVRRLAWSPPPADAASVRSALAEQGARTWQITLTAEPVAGALDALNA